MNMGSAEAPCLDFASQSSITPSITQARHEAGGPLGGILPPGNHILTC